ncbi:Beta-galactosidase-1-like protein [Desmophyllum pertusum]|uniref:Beta-galactosidase-1-like protein n=1 Tax=Desmophyllum pertusum TaxID=174260 RepID=A0A9X0D086_9CNID|nr:Beta-galactosidase-1-like protein [Desmophyllum pertusum]
MTRSLWNRLDRIMDSSFMKTRIPFSGPAVNISIPGLRDRGIVFVNQVREATLIRVGGRRTPPLKLKPGRPWAS